MSPSQLLCSPTVVRGLTLCGLPALLVFGLYVADSAAIHSLAAAEALAAADPSGGSYGAAFAPAPATAGPLARTFFTSLETQVAEANGKADPASSSAAEPRFLVAKRLDDTLYVALNDSMALIGGMTGWDEAAQTAHTISRLGLMEYQADTRRYLRNERELAMELPARLLNGTFYISLEDFGAIYGVPVSFDDEGRARVAVDGAELPVREQAELYEIHINRTKRTLTVKFLDREVRTYPVCVGIGVNTPLGRFRIANKAVWPSWRSLTTGRLVPPGRSNPLGPRWMGTTAVGDRGHVIGIHGNNRPSSIGRAVSHGCIRMYNKDAIELFDTIKVGTPVIIHR